LTALIPFTTGECLHFKDSRTLWRLSATVLSSRDYLQIFGGVAAVCKLRLCERNSEAERDQVCDKGGALERSL
jgi:hypothetical protein